MEDNTIDDLRQAIDKCKTPEKKAYGFIRLAAKQLMANQYEQVRESALAALQLDPNCARAYILISEAYLGYAEKHMSGFERRAINWLVVDKLQQGLRTKGNYEQSQIEHMICTRSLHFPPKDECFFRGIIAGQQYHIGDWIDETTTVRVGVWG